MVIKAISHHTRDSPKKLIHYIFDRRKNLLDPQGNRLVFKQHLRSYDKDKWIKQFNALEAQRKSHYANKSVVCQHIVVSFSDKSTQYLNRAIIKDLVQRFIDLYTEGNQLCVGAVHFDKDKNWHAHLVVSQLKLDGFSGWKTKSRFASIKKEVQDYQIATYPQLEDSVVRHGLKKRLLRTKSEKEMQMKKRTAVPSDKDILFERVQALFQKSQSIQQFEDLLAKADIKSYHRNQRLCGVYYKSKRYRLKRSLGIDAEILQLKDKAQERIKSLGDILEEKRKGLGYDLER